MPGRQRRSSTPPAAVPADARLLALDLEAWAGRHVAHAGHDLALLGKVVSLRLADEGATLQARVKDSGPHPYTVAIHAIDDGYAASCTCSWEEGPVCKHAVAAVEALRFPRPDVAHVPGGRAKPRRAGRLARGQGRIVTQAPVQAGTLLAAPGEWTLTREERIALAREEEVKQRRQRAKKERARITRLPMKGGPPRFRVASAGKSPYTVTLRGKEPSLASCTCPDWAKSELDSCKHIERVRAWFQRQPKRVTWSFASFWWKPRSFAAGAPDPLAELRFDAPASVDREPLGRWFDGDGWLRAVPGDLDAPTWVAQAEEAARGAATRAAVPFDLDAAVAERLAEAARAKESFDRLRAAVRGGELWNALIPSIGFQLHPYQVDGVEFLATRGRAFLADDMGLGKTLQAIVGAILLRRSVGAEKALVVCPASLKHQWQQEIERACGEKARVLEGGRLLRSRALKRWKSGFLVLNYELVLRDLDLVKGSKPDLVILDEAQRIKNWDTKTAKAIKQLTSPWAFILTGTPLENRLTELHSIVESLHPRALGPRWRLLPVHAVPGPNGRIAAYEDLDALRAKLSGFFLRRERREVLDQLPPRTDNTFWTEMTAAQWRPYRRHARRVATLLSQNRPLTAPEVRTLLQALTSMRILCNAWAQYSWDFAEPHLKRGPVEGDLRWLHSPKLEEFVHVLEDLLESNPGKVVVFSQWERLLRLAVYAATPLFERRGERAEVFHGGLDARGRQRVLEAFREDPALRVMFSTDSGGLGLNLQDSASVVVNLEVPWNPAVLEQRIGRVHRLGQRESVQVLHFVTRGAIEERVRQVVENKRALFDGLLVDDADRVELDDATQSTFVERMRTLMA